MPASDPKPRTSAIRIRRYNFGLRILRATSAGLSLALLLTGCASSRTPVVPVGVVREFATPPFYRIGANRGGTLLLMGTIHLGPPEGWRFSPALLDGLDRADHFILEVDLRAVTEDSISTQLANTAIIQPPNTLLDLVSPETAKLLGENDATLAKMGMPKNARKWKKPWYIALWLLESASTPSGFTASNSAENVILEAIGPRPLIGLETVEEQLEIFDKLSPHLQDMMLRDILLRLDSAAAETRALVGAWRRGDENLLEELTREEIDELPELEEFYAVVLRDRNRRWMSVFRSLLDDPEYAGETFFVGVGALHLVGVDGLVNLLRESGYETLRIDHQVKLK